VGATETSGAPTGGEANHLFEDLEADVGLGTSGSVSMSEQDRVDPGPSKSDLDVRRTPGGGVAIHRRGADTGCTGHRSKTDLPNDSAELHVIAADDFAAPAAATIALPQRVPTGFHGNWVRD
jgi:carotenoid cleavage dioxygenase-like enzyme